MGRAPWMLLWQLVRRRSHARDGKCRHTWQSLTRSHVPTSFFVFPFDHAYFSPGSTNHVAPLPFSLSFSFMFPLLTSRTRLIELQLGRSWLSLRGFKSIGVLFGCLGRKIDGPGLPGGFIYHLFALKEHLCSRGGGPKPFRDPILVGMCMHHPF